ncbi:hypothetical protein ACJW30_03G180200 [Castanea mollissima]
MVCMWMIYFYHFCSCTLPFEQMGIVKGLKWAVCESNSSDWFSNILVGFLS